MVPEGRTEAKRGSRSEAQNPPQAAGAQLLPCLPASLVSHPAWRLGNLLDVRPAAEFQRGHWVQAASLPLPAAWSVPTGDAVEEDPTQLLDRLLPAIFLPPRHEPLLVAANRESVAEIVVRHLQSRGRPATDGTVVTATALATWPAQSLQTGASRRCLWRPPAFLVRHVLHLPPPAAGPVLDLGAGSGRAAVWLAERGYRVTAVDHQAEALTLGLRLAVSRGVTCRFLQRDLRDPGRVPPGPWAAVLAFRFLQRSLLVRIGDLLQHRGVVMVRTYRRITGVADLPAARHCLEPGELLRLFTTDHFDVIVHEENLDAAGKPAAGIVARLRLPA